MCNKSAGCDNWLACEICEGWFHASCVKVKEEQYKAMQELESCQWYCKPCDTRLWKIIPTTVRLSDQVAAVDNRVRTVEQEINICSDKVDKMADDIDKK